MAKKIAKKKAEKKTATKRKPAKLKSSGVGNARLTDISSEQGQTQIVERYHGQPTKYQDDYCMELIKHMKDGYSFLTFATVIEVAPISLYRWLKIHEEFADARAIGDAYRLKWLETVGRKLMVKGGGSAPAWIFSMKMVTDFIEKIEIVDPVDTDDDGMIDVTPKRAERLARIKELHAKLESAEARRLKAKEV